MSVSGREASREDRRQEQSQRHLRQRPVVGGHDRSRRLRSRRSDVRGPGDPRPERHRQDARQ
uniref:Uncharacterized protein n=2 Tax=unclassified bacterial viruses TaxID=12333 RepID=A0AAU7J7S4_9VIRU